MRSGLLGVALRLSGRAGDGLYSRGRITRAAGPTSIADSNLPYYPNPLRDDRPVKTIHIDPFYLDETEVTNERYAGIPEGDGASHVRIIG